MEGRKDYCEPQATRNRLKKTGWRNIAMSDPHLYHLHLCLEGIHLPIEGHISPNLNTLQTSPPNRSRPAAVPSSLFRHIELFYFSFYKEENQWREGRCPVD